MLKQIILTLCLIGVSLESAATEKRDTKCLTDNIYHEARSESINGRISVGIITINRAKQKFYDKPNPICSAVYEKGQFTWTRKRSVIKELDTYDDIKNLSKKLYTNYYLHDIIPYNLAKLKTIIYYAEKGYRPIKNGLRVASIDSFYFWKPKKIKT